MKIMRRSVLIIVIITAFLLVNNVSGVNWQPVGKMPHPVSGGQALVVDSLIYVLGGYSDSLSGPTNIIQSYDPRTNVWQEIGRMVESRYNFVAANLGDGRVVACGGEKMISVNSTNLASIEIINNIRSSPTDNGEILARNVYFNRRYFTGHVYNNRLYIFGGFSQSISDSVLNPFVVDFNLNSESVESVKNDSFQNNTMLYHHTSVRIDSLVYIFGGISNGVSGKISVFNLNTYRYKEIGELQGVRAGGAAVIYNNKIYIIGGYNESLRALGTSEIYHSGLTRTEPGPTLNFNRKELMAVTYDNTIYVLGGKNEYDRSVPWIEKLDFEYTNSFEKNEVNKLKEFQLYNNYPNPFNATTVIRFDIPRRMELSLDIYSISGEHIKNIISGHFSPGTHTYHWDSCDKYNHPVASGVYIYHLYNNNYSKSKKMILVR